MCQESPESCPDVGFRHDAFTASLNALPAVNMAVFVAGDWIALPVAGLRRTRWGALTTRERTESAKLHGFAPCHRRGHRVDKSVDRLAGCDRAFTRRGCARINQFLHIHRLSLSNVHETFPPDRGHR